MLEVGSAPCSCREPEHAPSLVAITGGPGGGKTAVLQLAARVFCRHVAVLPEAAGVVFGGGFPRRSSEPARRAAQTAIFHVQRQLESLVIGERQVAVALCDRGTLDGLAYWEGPHGEFWDQVGSSHDVQLRRYAAVIHLQTPALHDGYNHDNPLRVESASEARELDERIEQVWAAHPHRLVIGSTGNFEDKALSALQKIRARLPSCCHRHPL